jgi:hypothetical protein
MLYNAIVNVLELKDGKDWATVRRELTDQQIGEIYHLFEGLWPLETDLLHLLPKPDGKPRAVYTGSIHPSAITDFALGASLYFGPMLIQHPFLHAGILRPEYSPVKNPKIYRQEFLKAVIFLFTVMPLVDQGCINLVPDSSCFTDPVQPPAAPLLSRRIAKQPETFALDILDAVVIALQPDVPVA